MRARLATSTDAASLARIYNQAIEERTATFETAHVSEDDALAWLEAVHPVVVVVDDQVRAFARASEYSLRECYRGVFEFAVYTDREHRHGESGSPPDFRECAACESQAIAMRELVTQARMAGAWKLLSRIFVENETTRALLAGLGFREVGTYYRHGKLDGRWRDVVVVEKFLAPIGAEAAQAPGPARVPREQLLLALEGGSLAARTQALEDARMRIETMGQLDADLLAAAADALFLAKVQDAAVRGRFVGLFRAYAALSENAARDLYGALFSRLEGRSIAQDLDAFYEALYVIKQVARGPDDGAPVPGLGGHVERLVGWVREAIDLPPAMRTRFSPGNVTSLLMTLALAAEPSAEVKHQLVELAAQAKPRHRVDTPTSLRPPGRASSPPPALPGPPPLPPPLPRVGLPPLLGVRAAPEPDSILDIDELLVVEAPNSEPATARSAGMEDDPAAARPRKRAAPRRKRAVEPVVVAVVPALPVPGAGPAVSELSGPIPPKKKLGGGGRRTRAKKAEPKE